MIVERKLVFINHIILVAIGILIPFVGTVIGALLVCFSNGKETGLGKKISAGFAAGVMVAASIWSLLLPSLDRSENLGKWQFVPASIGFILGFIFLIVIDKVVDKIIAKKTTGKNKNTFMLIFAVTLHNIPEGMAVGVAFASCLAFDFNIFIAGAFSLAIGIAIQNIPEGAIISLPLRSEGVSKGKALWYGILSGIVEPFFAFLTVLLLNLVVPVLPYLLAFAAGAMIYVVVQELILDIHENTKSVIGTLSFMLGFVIMMILDVLLG